MGISESGCLWGAELTGVLCQPCITGIMLIGNAGLWGADFVDVGFFVGVG